jgi:regulator of protease activity HflC (stomatin/prohibitin superfamily)
MRSQLPTLELDAVFEAKEELALAVKNALAETMLMYGYQIVQVLITDIDPDQKVKVRLTERLCDSLACEALSSIRCPAHAVCFSIPCRAHLDRTQNAMNEINSSKRLKYAVAERAEGDKILQVKAAEADAEAKYLSGEWVGLETDGDRIFALCLVWLLLTR